MIMRIPAKSFDTKYPIFLIAVLSDLALISALKCYNCNSIDDDDCFAGLPGFESHLKDAVDCKSLITFELSKASGGTAVTDEPAITEQNKLALCTRYRFENRPRFKSTFFPSNRTIVYRDCVFVDKFKFTEMSQLLKNPQIQSGQYYSDYCMRQITSIRPQNGWCICNVDGCNGSWQTRMERGMSPDPTFWQQIGPEYMFHKH